MKRVKNMKIKTVKINGIRGFCYCETPHIINLDSKHFFLFGENGTGKSSFFDALEWGLTGDVNETRVRKVGNKSEYLRNKFCSESDIPFVEIIYENNREERVCKRTLGGNSNCEIKENIENNFIDAKRIEEFVIDTKQSLWNRFARLLGFDSLIKFEEQLKWLRNKAKNEFDNIKQKLNLANQQIRNLEEKINNLNNRLKTKLGENWESLLENEDEKSLLKIVNELRDKERNLKNYEEVLFEKERLEKELKDTEDRKEQLKISTSEIKISRVINEALNYFASEKNIEKCPVCEQPIIQEKVFKKLQDLKEKLDKVISLDKQIIKLNEQLDSIMAKEIDLKSKIQKYYSKDIFNDNDKLKRFLKQELINLKMKIHEYDIKISLLADWGKYKQNIENLKEENKTLKHLEDEYHIKKKIFEDINRFYTLYEQKYGRVIQEELEEISKKEITNIYNEITQASDQYIEYIVIEPNIENHEITFKLKIRGREKLVDAITFLSTGHLRCLGFALLIARMKLNSNNLNFIVIDDPIYSVDHERRYFLIRYLGELAKKEYQLIITTSDRTFFDIIRHQFDKNSFNAFRTFLDNYSVSGIQEVILGSAKIEYHPRNYIEKAEKHLKMKDLRAAVLYSRLALETVLSIVAKKIELEVPYNDLERIGIRGFIKASIKEKLKEKYGNKSNEIERQFQILSNNRYFGNLLNGFKPSKEVHFPYDTRISYVYDEIKDLIDIVKDFTSFLLNLINKNKK